MPTPEVGRVVFESKFESIDFSNMRDLADCRC